MLWSFFFQLHVSFFLTWKTSITLVVTVIHQQGDKITTSYHYILFMQWSRCYKRQPNMMDFASQHIFMYNKGFYFTLVYLYSTKASTPITSLPLWLERCTVNSVHNTQISFLLSSAHTKIVFLILEKLFQVWLMIPGQYSKSDNWAQIPQSKYKQGWVPAQELSSGVKHDCVESLQSRKLTEVFVNLINEKKNQKNNRSRLVREH